jgi:hypothetical protein
MLAESGLLTAYCNFKIKVRVALCRKVYSQSVRLGVKLLETDDQRFLFSWKLFILHYIKVLCQSRLCKADHILSAVKFKPPIKSKLCYGRRSANLSWCQAFIWSPCPIFIVRQLWICWREAPSSTRGRVCSLQLLLGLASADTLGSEYHRTRNHILMPHIWNSPNLEGQVPVFVSPRNRVGQLYTQALGGRVILTIKTLTFSLDLHYGAWARIAQSKPFLIVLLLLPPYLVPRSLFIAQFPRLFLSTIPLFSRRITLS